MKRDCSTCVCKEGSCYPSTTIFDEDKTCKSYIPDYEGYIAELEKENEDLEAEVKEWKDKADLWCKTANLKDHNIMINKELEKENAELKEKVNILDNCDRLGDMITEAYKDQLTKAKELIKNLLSAYTSYADSFDDRDNEIVEEAEQFLNSEVEK